MMKCYWSQLLTVVYDRHRVGELRIPHLSVNNGYAVMLLLAEKADFYLMEESLARQRVVKGIFDRVIPSRKFVWRYIAYRGRGQKWQGYVCAEDAGEFLVYTGEKSEICET